MKDILKNYLHGNSIRNYFVHRYQENGIDTFYFPNSLALTAFLSHYGKPSPNIFDYDGSGVCGSADLMTFLAGKQATIEGMEVFESAEIIGKFSSGWYLNHPNYDALFLKVTPYDEDGDLTPDVINSFFLEGVTEFGSFKIWFHVTPGDENG